MLYAYAICLCYMPMLYAYAICLCYMPMLYAINYPTLPYPFIGFVLHETHL